MGQEVATPQGPEAQAIINGSAVVQTLAPGSINIGNGTAVDNGVARSNHTLIVTTTNATVTTGNFQLQVSHDNVNWFGTAAPVLAVQNTVQAITYTGAARYARGAITTGFTGGASITATVMSAG